MATDRGDLLQGTLDMLVLKALQLEPMHGWGITERIEQWSESVLQLGQGTLYPALYRLERQGLIRSGWKVTENNRRARYYALTRAGRRHFSDEIVQWRRMSRAVNLVLEITVTEGEGPANAFRLDEVPGVAVVSALAQGTRCARSWKILPEVGTDPDYPDLSPRDAQAMRERQAAGL